MHKRYISFGPYLKAMFGSVVYKVNVDAGFTCPNRDGTVGYGGCIYCNNDSFRPSACKPTLSISEQIKNGIDYLSSRFKAKKFLVYFQPYTNTHAETKHLQSLYTEALANPHVIGLAIGTRPDAVDEQKLDMIAGLARDKFILIEYGLQSIYDKTLKYINRCHSFEQFVSAVRETTSRGIHTGVHLIAGFPTESKEEMLKMADVMSELPIGFIKLHQLQVVKHTTMAKQYEKQPFYTFAFEEYVDFVVDFVERLRSDIVIQRLFAISPDDILIAPQWGKDKQEIILAIDRRFEQRGAFQGSKCVCSRG